MNTKSDSNIKIGLSTLAVALSILMPASASADVSFSDNFNSYENGATLGSPWVWNVETFSSSGVYNSGYYPGELPSPGVHAILNTESGNNASNVLKFYGDYGYSPNFEDNKLVQTSIYINRVLSAADVVAGTVRLDFDYYKWAAEEGGLAGVATARGWVKLLATDFSATYYTNNFDITASSGHGSAEITFDGTQEGLNLQYGFSVVSQNYSPTAIAIDNVAVARVAAIPEPSAFSLIGACFAGAFVIFKRRRSAS
jgi:hypothetical protein